jgi:CDP-glucose 4,6-dehydratase
MAEDPSPRWQPGQAFWRDRKVAVTGATGFLGSHLCQQLVDAGADVVILRRDEVVPTDISRGWLDRVAVVEGDIADQALLERLLGEYEVRTVFHLAAQTQVQVANHNPVSTFEANIAGTWALLEAIRRTPHVEQAVCASSDKAYGTQPTLPYHEGMPLLAINPYDVSKACADLITQSYHHRWATPVSITRCGNFFGPGDTNWERLVPGTIRSLLRGERPMIRSNGSLVRDYLYVVDGALAYLRLAEAMAEDPGHIGEAYNFSTERPLSVLELVTLLQAAAGTDLPLDVRDTAAHEIDAQHLSATKAKERLGWAPNHTVEEALAETVAWYADHLAP